MGEVPVEYLPPKEHLPQKIYILPEVQLPQKLNLTDLALDKNIFEGRGSKVAILFRERKMTFFEVQKEVNRLTNALRALGLEKNDRVMLRSPNRPEFVVACLACWKIGAIPVLVNHLLIPEEIIFRANDTEARTIVVSSDTLAEVEESLPHCPTVQHVIVFGERNGKYHFYEDLVRDQSEEAETAQTTRDDLMRIIYSSGTTGKPKGIITTIGDAVAARELSARYTAKLTSEDVVGGHPAFTFALGSGFIWASFGNRGSALSIVEKFDPVLMFETIQAHRISVLRCVPTSYRMMLGLKDAEKKYDLSSLRLCQSAGEYLPGETVKEWKRRFGVPILDSLGSADLNSILSTWEDTPEDKLDSSGTPLPGVECKIVDENFQEVPRGTPGELIVRGPWGQQYWRRPDIQQKAVKNGWNRPGLIYVEDEDGYFWYQGRDDEMIVSSGYKIPGGEVEGALLSHPAVLEAAVVPSPDPVRGNIVKAFVVLKEGVLAVPSLAEELKNFVKGKIEPYKYPREIEFVDGASLARTVTGKIQRYVLRDKERKKGQPLKI